MLNVFRWFRHSPICHTFLYPKEGLFFVNTMIIVEAPSPEERAIASRAGFSKDWAARILQRPLEVKDGFAIPQKEAGSGNRVGRKRCSAFRLR